MRYRRLGRSELSVSVIGIGTTQLRRVPEKQAIATLKRAFELGVNHVNSGVDYEGADDLIVAAGCGRALPVPVEVPVRPAAPRVVQPVRVPEEEERRTLS